MDKASRLGREALFCCCRWHAPSCQLDDAWARSRSHIELLAQFHRLRTPFLLAVIVSGESNLDATVSPPLSLLEGRRIGGLSETPLDRCSQTSIRSPIRKPPSGAPPGSPLSRSNHLSSPGSVVAAPEVPEPSSNYTHVSASFGMLGLSQLVCVVPLPISTASTSE